MSDSFIFVVVVINTFFCCCNQCCGQFETLIHACKVITVDITKKACDSISCNPTKEDDVCKPYENASYYYVGDDKFDLQCQPACFNTKQKKIYAPDGKQATETPFLNFNNGKCRYVPTPMVSYLEKSFYRSQTIYEKRVNDMPTGFSRIKSDNPFGSGFDYEFNKSYCGYYDLDFLENGNCGESWLGFLADSVIGMHFINAVKSVPGLIFNNNKPFDIPAGVPALPESIPKNKTVDGWKNDINSEFIVPELIDTTPKEINLQNISNSRHRLDYLHNNFHTPSETINLNVDENWLDKLTEALTNGLNDLNMLEQLAL